MHCCSCLFCLSAIFLYCTLLLLVFFFIPFYFFFILMLLYFSGLLNVLKGECLCLREISINVNQLFSVLFLPSFSHYLWQVFKKLFCGHSIYSQHFYQKFCWNNVDEEVIFRFDGNVWPEVRTEGSCLISQHTIY